MDDARFPRVLKKLDAIPYYEPGKPPKPLFDLDYMDELEAMWGRPWGAQSRIGRLKMAMIQNPKDLIVRQQADYAHDPEYHARGDGFQELNLEDLMEEHDNFVRVLEKEGVELVDMNIPPGAQGLYTEVPSGVIGFGDVVMLNGGAVIPRLGIAPKRGCEFYWAKRLLEIGCPILYTVHGKGCFEGGCVVFMDCKHVLVGLGTRTNVEGLKQLEPVFRQCGVEEIHPVYLAGYLNKRHGRMGGQAGFYHTTTVFGMVDIGKAVIYPPGMDYLTVDYLIRKGIKLIEVPWEEANNGVCNLLALRPGRVILAAGNPYTAEALDKEGVEVIEVPWTATRRHSSTGPTCAMGALVREPIYFV
ncbi:MAG: hypothetical protein HYU86_04775 [Chloroflexi bacterium]|nr:hypothetical protein [Chloroflexota bacterium]